MPRTMIPESLLHVCLIMAAISFVSFMVGFVLIILDIILGGVISEDLVFSFLSAAIVLFVALIVIMTGYDAFSLIKRMW